MQRVETSTILDDERGRLVEILREGSWKQMNLLTIARGEARGGHYHRKLVECFLVIEGVVRFEVTHEPSGASQEFTIAQGECVIIEPFDCHTLTALEDVTLVSLYSDVFDPTDIHSGRAEA